MSPLAPHKGSLEKHPGAEPLPGYRLLNLLGRGGFGEVWKCEAPGGLHKAIKFVAAGGDQGRQELAAFAQVKAIRHPFLLTLERVELIAGELVMVMELADGQLHDRFRQCLKNGLRGIPREELLGYLAEAADALDMISTRHGLQHLDVKPENLFLVSEHVKVGDYGLVRRAEAATPTARGVGFTPQYCAPEVLSGRVHPQSDQYSLALVYFELLTGTFPYSGRSAQELMFQHVNATPNLSALSPGDLPVVSRALSKNPADRFPSCKAFIRALSLVPEVSEPTGGSVSVNPATSTGSGGGSAPTSAETPTKANRTDGRTQAEPAGGPARTPPSTGPFFAARATPPHRGPIRDRAGKKNPESAPELIRGLPFVVSVDRLHGMSEAAARPPSLAPADFVAEVVRFAEAQGCFMPGPGVPAPAAWTCRFLSTVPTALVPLKLAVVGERWGMSVDDRDMSGVVLRWKVRSDTRKSVRTDARTPPPQPPSGFEVSVSYPVPPSAELVAVGALFGSPDEEVRQKAEAEITAILKDIRSQLNNLDERRSHPRHPADLPLRVYPYYSDGVVGAPIVARCLDVSAGGVRFQSPSLVPTQRLFLEFPGVEAVADLAIQGGLVRSVLDPAGNGFVSGARYQRIRFPRPEA